MLTLLAVAAGASVANVYYAQPLLDRLAQAFALDRAVAGAVLAKPRPAACLHCSGCCRWPIAVTGGACCGCSWRHWWALLWLAAARWLAVGMLLAGLLGTALTQGLIAYTATLAPPERRGRR